jgi:hypothetical protein
MPTSEIVSSVAVPCKHVQLLADRRTKDNVSSLDSARARKVPVLSSAQRIKFRVGIAGVRNFIFFISSFFAYDLVRS